MNDVKQHEGYEVSERVLSLVIEEQSIRPEYFSILLPGILVVYDHGKEMNDACTTAELRVKWAECFVEASTWIALVTIPYEDYLQTTWWKNVREAALKRAEYRCQVCYSPNNLHVHHRTYERRGKEKDSDLTVLCSECHKLFHDNRRLAKV